MARRGRRRPITEAGRPIGALKAMHRLAAIVLLALLGDASAAAQSLTPIGVWLHDNERIKVEIAPCGDRLCGTIVWLKFPDDARGLPLTDSNNPERSLRARPVMGLTVIRGLRRSGERTWSDGNIYNPDDGKAYSSRVTVQDAATLRVRAYVFLPVFGETQIWTRVQAAFEPGANRRDHGIANDRRARPTSGRDVLKGEGNPSRPSNAGN